ncbi:class I adenylate-forming enzyme family protein [Phenylobacterium sp.]|uniref:class I adenylate-forming enzyme family protein n=1 Tax=Phenylobacterium sp. TaxID=1871053 RepID=UPI002600178B|nr:class I adenylate-forming enzyme family protein [Phenylobacterium sp.]MBX3482596.1 acyl--CoA ligase [Phenylobacterium sp.]MCW5760460.1 acyl--CoA ligase [Phenylobacterium sp.]
MFDGYIRDGAAWRPRAPAVILPGRPPQAFATVSYARFDADIDRLGRLLATEFGLAPGRGAVSLAVADAYVGRVALCALARLGVASAPYDDHAAARRLVYGLDADAPPPPDAIVLTREQVAAALAAPHEPLPRLAPDPDALVRVQLSSGTTAAPKRVGFTWSRLEIATLTALRIYGPGKLGVWVPLTGPDSLMGFGLAVAAWSVGATVAAGMTLETLPALMEAHGQGVCVLTPIQLRNLLTWLPDGFRPRPGWRLQVGGSALPPALAREALLRLTPDVWHGYGATESNRIAAGPAAALADVPGAVGHVPASAHVEIVGDDGRPLPDGRSGEIVVRSTRTAPGYLDDPAATAARFDPTTGAYRTGDLGRRLPDGRLVIEGRLDERMNLGGRKFMPHRLETPALEVEGVLDAAGFAAPGDDGLDQAWLAVTAAPDFDRDRLIRHLAAVPDLPPLRLAWTDEIPRNAMGKVDRATLRARLLSARAKP